MQGFFAENWPLLVAALVPAIAIAAALRRIREEAPHLFDVGGRVLVTSEGGLALSGPDGSAHLAWDDVTEVRIRTSDRGPLAEDVHWEFASSTDDVALRVPSSAAGLGDFLESADDHLDGFDHEAVIRAMSSFEPEVFVLRTRSRDPA